MTFREQYWEELEEAKAEARVEARAEGLAEGRAEGEKAGLEQGERKTAIKNAENLLQMNLLTPEQIAKAVELPLGEILKLKKKFKV